MRIVQKRPSIWKLINTEYKKIIFLRSSKIFLGVIILLSLIMGIVFCSTTSVTEGKVLSELPPMDVMTASMLGIDVAAIMLIIFTALSISSEFSTKLINVSLAVTPNRKRFYFSKLITYFLLSLVMSLIVTVLTYFAGHLILKLNGLTLDALGSARLLQFTFGCFLMPIFYCLLTVAATFIFRSSAGAITLSFGVLLFPALINLFSNDIRRLVIPIMPMSALHSLAGVAQASAYESLGIGTSILILILWISGTSLIGIIQFERKDV